jgi:hypothetical protein
MLAIIPMVSRLSIRRASMLPTLFLSHGAPTLPLTDSPAKRYLETLAKFLPERPRVSATAKLTHAPIET